jgi:tetratricopeptide (TPR) repeat protein
MKVRSETLILFSVVLGLTVGTLSGCATSEKQTKEDGGYTAHYASANMSAPPITTAADYERLGDMYYDKDNLSNAFLQYEKSLKLEPDNFRVLYKKGLSLLAGGMEEEAVKEFQAVLKMRPDYALAYGGMGQAYFQMNKYQDGIKYLTKAIELDGTLWKPRNYLGIIYDRQKNHKMAIIEYKAGIEINPKVGLLYNNLGVSYSETGDYNQAISAFKSAIENKYDKSKVYNNLGLALSKIGKYQEALMTFKKAGDEAKAYNNLGCILLQQGDYKQAIDYFEKAINITPYFYDTAFDNLKKAKVGYNNGAPKRKRGGINDMGDDDYQLGNKAGTNNVGGDDLLEQ